MLAPLHRQDAPAAKSEKAAPRSQHWLHRDLRVRFVDKLHKGGQYYNTKVRAPHLGPLPPQGLGPLSSLTFSCPLTLSPDDNRRCPEPRYLCVSDR